AARTTARPRALHDALPISLRYEEWLRETCNDERIAERKMENVTELTDWIARLARQEGEGTLLADLVARLSLFSMLNSESLATRSDRKSTRLNSSHQIISYA